MEILMGILFAPFILAIGYITISLLLKMFIVLCVDILGIMGFEEPKQYVKYNWNI